MPASVSVQPNLQVLRDLYNNPVQAFLDLNYAENSQYYTDYFLFALKQDSSLADTLTNTQWQNLLAGQDGQIDATKLAGLLTKFTSLTECQPLMKFLKEKPFANMDSLSAEQANLMLNMDLDHTTTEVLKQKIVAHRQQVFEEVTVCCKEQQKIDDLVAQIPEGSTDKNAIDGEVLKSIFLDIQQQQKQSMFSGNANLQADDITTVHVNKSGKIGFGITRGQKDRGEKARVFGNKAKYSYLVTGDGKIIITPKSKALASSSNTYKKKGRRRRDQLYQFYAKFTGSYKKVDKVVVLQLGIGDKFELKSQVLVHQNLSEHQKKLKSAKFSEDVRADAPGAKAVKDGYFLVDRKPLTVAHDISKSGSYGNDKIKGLVSMTFTQVIASQQVGEVMGDIKIENIQSANNGNPGEIFDQRARGDQRSKFVATAGFSFPSNTVNNGQLDDSSIKIHRSIQRYICSGKGRDIAYVDTFGMLSAFLGATQPQEGNNLRTNIIAVRSAMVQIQQQMKTTLLHLTSVGEVPSRNEHNKDQLPLLHEVLCRTIRNGKTIGDALGGPAVFGITLPNRKLSFADLDVNEIELLPQIFTDKLIQHDFEPMRLEQQMIKSIATLLREKKRGLGLVRKIREWRSIDESYYDQKAKDIFAATQIDPVVSSGGELQNQIIDLKVKMEALQKMQGTMQGKSTADIEGCVKDVMKSPPAPNVK